MTMQPYRFEYVDVTALLPAEKADIANLYRTYFQELGLVFEPGLDADFTHPEKYYHIAARGAYAVIRHMQSSEAGEEQRHPIIGVVGVRNVSDAKNEVTGDNCCELKRFYVDKAHRGGGAGLGRKLLIFILQKALELGYTRVVADTKKKLVAANQLYQRFGFVECGSYNSNWRADLFLSLDLTDPKTNFAKINAQTLKSKL